MPRIYNPPLDLSAIRAEITQLRNGLPIRNPAPNPILTSNASGGVTVSASSEYPGGYEAWRAMDGVSGTRWASLGGTPHHWQIDYGRIVQATAVELRRDNAESQCFNQFYIDISTDLIGWTNVIYEPNAPFHPSNLLRYELPPGTTFRAIRLRNMITLANPSNTVVGLEYFGLVSQGVIVPSNTILFTQASHGFDLLDVVAWNGTQFVGADKNGPIDTFLISAIPDANHFEYFAGGILYINHPFGSDIKLLYLGDNRRMTLTAPPAGQTPPEQIILGQVLGDGVLEIYSEWRAV